MEESVRYVSRAVMRADIHVFDGSSRPFSQDRVGYGSHGRRCHLAFNEIRVHASQDRDFLDYKVEEPAGN